MHIIMCVCIYVLDGLCFLKYGYILASLFEKRQIFPNALTFRVKTPKFPPGGMSSFLTYLGGGEGGGKPGCGAVSPEKIAF